MDIAERLKRLRQSANLSQEQIASRLGHPQAWLSRREIGATRVKPDEIADIAEACGYRMEMIFLPRCPGARPPADAPGRLDDPAEDAAELGELLSIISPEHAGAIADLLRALPRMDDSTRDFVIAQLQFAAAYWPK